jgi:hypothetical protein
MIPDELKRLKPMTGKERLGAHRNSEYLGAEDIDPDAEPIVTIENLYYGLVTLQRGKEEKDVISFSEEKVPGINLVRPLIVNATNRKTLKKLYKKVDAETLVGKKIQLYVEHGVRDPQTGDKTDGIRIRMVIPKVEEIKCSKCGHALVGVGNMNARALADYTRKKFGAVLCAECGKKEADARADAEQTEKKTEEQE